ncbi:MAG: orotidine-5'-phosphate decarboxylase [Verrucomicrobiota bacterium]
MATDKIIVALDYASAEEAMSMVHQLKDHIGFYKIGSQLFTLEGPAVVKAVLAEGVDVMLDLKFHDIPVTVIKSIEAVKDLGCRFATLHTTGGAEMMLAAQLGTENSNLELLGVTVLTSMDSDTLGMVGFDHSVPGQVMMLARLASQCGLSGLVCSPQEIGFLREMLEIPMKLVTPGIRAKDAETDDQRRTMTPSQALEEGADHIVIGRPITKAPDPAAAARAILDECGL